MLLDAATGLRVRRATYRAVLAEREEEITEQTATRDLTRIAELGLIEARGERRGRYYVAGPDLTAIRRDVVAARNPRDDSDPFDAA